MKRSILFIIHIFILLYLSAFVSHAQDLVSYDNNCCTYSKSDKKVSLKPVKVYVDDISGKVFKPTKQQRKKAKQVYNKLKKLKGNKTLKISSKQYKNLSKIISIVQEDYFELSTLEGMQWYDDDGYLVYRFKGKTVQKCLKLNKKLIKKVKSFIKQVGVTKNTTQHDAIILINNYMRDNYYYKEIKKNTYGKLGIVYKGYGICEDFSSAFQSICNYCGIKTGVVSDFSLDHAYNIVYIDSKYYYIDVTWNCSIKDNKYMFLRKEDLESLNHKVDHIDW